MPHIQIHRDFDLEESRTDVSGLLAISLSIGGLPLPNLAPLLSFESAVPSEPTLEIDISDYLDKTLQSIIAMPTVNFGTTIGNLEDLSDITESISYAMSFLLVDVCETLVQFDDKLQWIQQTANRSHSYVLPDVISHYLDDLVTGLCSTSSNNIANIDIGRAATFEVTYGSSFVQVINLLTHTTPVKSPPRERVMRTDFLLPSEIFDMLDFELTSICGQIRLDNATTVQHRIYSTKHKRRHHVITGVTSNILDTLLVSTLRETIQSDIATVVATHIKRKHKHTAPIYPRDDTRPRVTFILPPDYDDDY